MYLNLLSALKIFYSEATHSSSTLHVEILWEDEGPMQLADGDNMQEVDAVLKRDIGDRLIADRVTAKVNVISRLLGGVHGEQLRLRNG